MSNSKKITKNTGRPTKYDDELVSKLEGVLRMGGTIDQACSYAMISRETYYQWLETKDGFSDKMAQAQTYLNIAAKNVVGNSIIRDKNDTNAKWWLEKTEFRDKGSNTNVQVNVLNQIKDDKDKYDL